MKKSTSTILKHMGQDLINKSANPAVVRASTVFFKSMQALIKQNEIVKKKKPFHYYDYGRYGSNTTIELQNIIKELEQAYHVFLTPTGFGAVALCFLGLGRPGDEFVVSDNVYQPTKDICNTYLKELGIKTKFYNPDDLNDLKQKISNKTKLIFVENPGSNTFEFQDLKKIISFAKRKKIFTVLDNTWGTPLYLQPLKIGFDVSISSATKYFSGHSDAMGGTMSVNQRVYKKVYLVNKLMGYRLAPDEAYLIIRGLRTLDIRLKAHHNNVIKVIKFLKKHKKIKEILYPHKPTSKNYKMWKKYYSGSTGLLGILIKSNSKASVVKFVNSLKLFGIGYSWGGFESLVVHQDIAKKRYFWKYKPNEHIVRMHIGLEDSVDLINDLKQALKHIK